MHRSVCFFVLLLLCFTANATLRAKSASKPQRQPTQSGASDSTLEGCGDEQDGRYVLIDDRTRRLIVYLVAEGFPREGFAKHLGQTVTIKGASSTEEGRPVFRVRSIVELSDVRGPQQH